MTVNQYTVNMVNAYNIMSFHLGSNGTGRTDLSTLDASELALGR